MPTQIFIFILSFMVGCQSRSRMANTPNTPLAVYEGKNQALMIADNREIDFQQINSAGFDDSNKLTLDFTDFKLKIHRYRILDRELKLQNDTLKINTDIGFNLENALIEVIPLEKTDKFQILMSLEQNLTAYIGEKNYKDLNRWKSIEEFVKIEDSLGVYFRIPSYGRKEKEEKIKTQFAEIKKVVLSLETDWNRAETEKADSYKNLPVELWISRVFIKIVSLDKSGNKKNIVLVSNSSWGC